VTSGRPFSILDKTFANIRGALFEAINQPTSLLDGHLEIILSCANLHLLFILL